MRNYRVFKFLLCAAALALSGGCLGIKWSAASRVFDPKSRMLLEAKDIVIETPDPRLPEREILTYNVQWIGLTVGNITISIKGIDKVNGRDAYVLEAVFQSNAFLSSIYKIEDRYVSYMDVEKLYTLRHEVYRRDGSYKKDAITDFDQVNHKAHFKNFIDNSEKNFDIPENLHDVLTAAYFLMLIPLKGGDNIELPVCNNESNYQLVGAVESRAFIKTPGAGEKRAFLIQPYARLNGELVKKGNLKAYFSCDKRRLPLLAVLQGPVFTEATIVLSKVDYPPPPVPPAPPDAPALSTPSVSSEPKKN
jgi:hypothetical protein